MQFCILSVLHKLIETCYKDIFVREDLSPEACQQCKKDFASRRSTSGSQLSLSKPADVGHSTIPDDSSLR